MKASQILLLSAICIFVSACATQAQQQYKAMEAQLSHTIEGSKKCGADLQNEDAYQRSAQIFILGANDPDAVKKMTIERFATQSEKNDLMHLTSLQSSCRKMNLDNIGNVHSDFVTLLAGWYAENDEIIVNIVRDNMTIADANEVLNKRFSRRQHEWNSVASNVTKQLQGAHQSEMQERQRAAAALQQWNYQQQMINSLNRPTTTNCHQFGNNINCTSY